MPRNLASTLLRLFVLSLVVGLLLSAFDVRPESLLGAIGGTAESIFDSVADLVAWAVPYVLIGAVVVVPVWLVIAVLRHARRR